MTATVQFSRSQSQMQAISPVDGPWTWLTERYNNAVSYEHLVGTSSMVFSAYASKKTIDAATLEKNWLRVGTLYAGLASLIATLFSKRESAYPEADTFKGRVIKAALHPDRHSMHAFTVYAFLPTFISRIDHLYHGFKNPKEEYPRIVSGVVGMAFLGLVWKSMFSNQSAIGEEKSAADTKSPENMMQFIMNDKEGLIGRLLPPIMGLAQLAEGEVKIRHGWESGENFRLSGMLHVINDLVMLGYTYNQLWKAEKQKLTGTASWEEKILKNAEKYKNLPSWVAGR